MRTELRYIARRVAVGLCIALLLSFCRHAHAKGLCPGGQVEKWATGAVRYGGGNESSNPYSVITLQPPKCGVGSNYKSVSALRSGCFYAPGSRVQLNPDPYPDGQKLVFDQVGQSAELTGPGTAFVGQKTFQEQYGASNPSTLFNPFYEVTLTCVNPVCPPAGTDYGVLVKPGPADFCDAGAYEGCRVIGVPYMELVAGAGSYVSYDIEYSGEACGTQPAAPQPSERASVSLVAPPTLTEPQQFRMTRGTFNVVKWVTAGVSVPSEITDHNGSAALDNGAVVQQQGAAAEAPNGGPPITITYRRDENLTVNVYPAQVVQASSNRDRVIYQSGGPRGGGGPPNSSPPSGSSGGSASGGSASSGSTPGSSSGTAPGTSGSGGSGGSGSGSGSSGGGSAGGSSGSGSSGSGSTGSSGSAGSSGSSGGTGSSGGSPEGECTGNDCGAGGTYSIGGFEALPTYPTFAESTAAFGAEVRDSEVMTAASSLGAALTYGSGECPTPTFNVLERQITMTSHCTLFATYGAGIRTFLILAASLTGIALVLKA